jgi:hypothetical protein
MNSGVLQVWIYPNNVNPFLLDTSAFQVNRLAAGQAKVQLSHSDPADFDRNAEHF